ncbi:MAG: hypothetical protein HKN25_05660 [Pyrinomonadaceae bacterium]|nr:hypothetical protein [Pyrinomonadaceae bacterium]
MKTIYSSLRIKSILHFAVIAAMLFGYTLQGFAQTAAGTPIRNTASATYGDGSGPADEFSTVSNEVTVTVARVAGLTITPDAGSGPAVVPGQTGVTMDFTVTNTGNFDDNVVFLASGGSINAGAGATVTAAVVDPTGTPVDIFGNAADVSYPLNRGASVTVRVTLSISAAATPGSIQVFLGDESTNSPTFDNVAAGASPSANEVRTVSTGALNGAREARGDRTLTVENDAQIRAELTAPAGPVALGSDITYSARACNTGARPLDPVDPDGAGPIPAAVYIVAPIPAGTELTNTASLPAGTYYTTSPLSTAPFSATWTATPPGTLSSVTRILLPVSSAAIAAGGACSSSVTFDVTITTNNANTPIYEIVDGFGNNSIGSTITDQSGDTVANKGDGNANFDEPLSGGTASPTQGFQLPTLLTQVFDVLNGPDGAANAVGPTDNNDDFTNKSVNTGIAGVAPGGVTTAPSNQVVYTNSLQNTGNADDTFRLTYVPGSSSLPAGSTVEIFDGSSWVNVTNGTAFVDVSVPFGTALVDYDVRVTLPGGVTVLTGYDAVIRATSQNDNTKSNDTIDRLYTGFVRLDKAVVVSGGIAAGGTSDTDVLPGSTLTYTVAYTNISTAAAGGNVGLTAVNLVITEDGNAAPNNWGATTTRVAGQEFDYLGSTGTTPGTGTVNVVSPTAYTDTIPSLAPGAVGRFVFTRSIN